MLWIDELVYNAFQTNLVRYIFFFLLETQRKEWSITPSTKESLLGFLKLKMVSFLNLQMIKRSARVTTLRSTYFGWKNNWFGNVEKVIKGVWMLGLKLPSWKNLVRYFFCHSRHSKKSCCSISCSSHEGHLVGWRPIPLWPCGKPIVENWCLLYREQFCSIQTYSLLLNRLYCL